MLHPCRTITRLLLDHAYGTGSPKREHESAVIDQERQDSDTMDRQDEIEVHESD